MAIANIQNTFLRRATVVVCLPGILVFSTLIAAGIAAWENLAATPSAIRDAWGDYYAKNYPSARARRKMGLPA